MMVVIPANQDISTSDGLKIAKELDPKGERSIGVLTKVDIMDEGTSCEKILKNLEIPLKYGYIAIKGRTTLETRRGVNVKLSLAKE